MANDTSDFNYGGELYIGQGPYLYAPAPFSITLYLNTSLHNPFICTPESSVYSSANCGNPVDGDQQLHWRPDPVLQLHLRGRLDVR